MGGGGNSTFLLCILITQALCLTPFLISDGVIVFSTPPPTQFLSDLINSTCSFFQNTPLCPSLRWRVTQEEIHALGIVSCLLNSQVQKSISNYTKTQPLGEMVFPGAMCIIYVYVYHLQSSESVKRTPTGPQDKDGPYSHSCYMK